jgi:hypothetical protein
MMAKWNSSPHPISDLRDWQEAGRLEVRPDFQRREVWSDAAKIMLIDTILRDVPMPKMFLWNELVNKSTHRRVIDGQQRILAILGFLSDKFKLDSPYTGPHHGKFFSELSDTDQERILHYKIDFNEAIGFSEAEVREVYSRVNKYSMPLNRQELRRADYPGSFLDLATELALDDFLDENRVFSIAQRRRMGDVEFVSELLAGALEGPQDKKGDLDYFYVKYAKWDTGAQEEIRKEFRAAVSDMTNIFADDISLRTTRFRQKSDFYTLFLSIVDLRRTGGSLGGKPLSPLRADLKLLDSHIAPESSIEVFSEYAIKCVSQANSVSSRSWRRNFLTAILAGTYKGRKPTGPDLIHFYAIAEGVGAAGIGSLFDSCSVCGEEFKDSHAERVLDWDTTETVYQISNARWRAVTCKPLQR